MNSINPVLTAIRERRSIRRFTDEALTTEELLAVLEAGRWAPSGLNNQPWRFLALRRGDARVETLAGYSKYGRILRQAAACIAVFLGREAMYNAQKDHQGAGACLQNMLLAAHAQGLGAVWIGEIVNQGAEVTAALGLDPAALELQAVIALGRPDQKGAAERRPLEELLLENL